MSWWEGWPPSPKAAPTSLPLPCALKPTPPPTTTPPCCSPWAPHSTPICLCGWSSDTPFSQPSVSSLPEAIAPAQTFDLLLPTARSRPPLDNLLSFPAHSLKCPKPTSLHPTKPSACCSAPLTLSPCSPSLLLPNLALLSPASPFLLQSCLNPLKIPVHTA
jgi:hypothetical protein